MPSAPPRSLSSLAASVHLPQFRQSLFPYVSDRLRSSGIVWDRLRSSGIVWDRPRSYDRTAARRPPFPQNCRNIRPISPAEPAKERVNSRQNTPAKASEKKASPRHLGVVVISNDRSTKVGIYSMPAFNSDSGSHESWRADRRASRSRQPCPTPESDELEFRQMSTSPKHHPPSTIHYPLSTIHYPLFTIHHSLSTNRLCTRFSPLFRPGNFAAVAPMVPAVKAMSPIVDKCRPKVDPKATNVAKRRSKGDQCRPNVDPNPNPQHPVTSGRQNILSRGRRKVPRKRGHWKTLVDFDTLSIPSSSMRAALRAPAPGAASAPAGTQAPRRRPPPAGTVNLKSPQLQKPHVPSTLVRKCARSKSRTGRSCIDARRIEYIFRQQTRAMGTRECEQSARRVISITQLAVARPDKEASRKERPGPPERLPHSIQERRFSWETAHDR